MINKQENICPVCGYNELEEPAYNVDNLPSFEICNCCGTEFGYDDATKSHLELRQNWIQNGCKWRSNSLPPSVGWSAKSQLKKL